MGRPDSGRSPAGRNNNRAGSREKAVSTGKQTGPLQLPAEISCSRDKVSANQRSARSTGSDRKVGQSQGLGERNLRAVEKVNWSALRPPVRAHELAVRRFGLHMRSNPPGRIVCGARHRLHALASRTRRIKRGNEPSPAHLQRPDLPPQTRPARSAPDPGEAATRRGQPRARSGAS